MRSLLPFLLLAVSASSLTAQLSKPQPQTTPLRVVGTHFELNGKPFQVLSGELEYARIPRADWHDRLRKVRAMGLNSITVYVFWNLHEAKPGVFDFSGQNDVAEFLHEAQQDGLQVILRPGPYVCAEWDLGGYPAWLLKSDPSLASPLLLRSSDPAYLRAACRWMLRLGQELAPLQASRGGPIVAVQVENEYGSFDVKEDRVAYLKQVLQMVREAGFGESLLYTADGGDVLDKGSIPGLLAAVDYGTGDATRSLDLLRRFQPDAPLYAAEYWDGWFDHWGEPHQRTDAAEQEKEIRSVIATGGSINLYMIHGGTTFGWHNGANAGHDGLNTGNYQPDVSSYDYDAPLDESGRPRPKYFALRSMIAELTHTIPPPVPATAPLLTLPTVRLTATRSIFAGLPPGTSSPAPLAMEELGQSFGYTLYRTSVPATATTPTSTLSFDAVHSYARVYIDGHLQGVVDRRVGQTKLTVAAHSGQQLDILVENGGRINFTTVLRTERAGILGDVHLDGHVLTGWQNIPMPLETPPATGFLQHPCSGPCFYSGTLQIQTPADTYLDTTQLGKGAVWVNGHLLGRFWSVGPMGSLFVPGAWLHAGPNSLTVLDWNGGPAVSVTAVDHAIFTEPRAERLP